MRLLHLRSQYAATRRDGIDEEYLRARIFRELSNQIAAHFSDNPECVMENEGPFGEKMYTVDLYLGSRDDFRDAVKTALKTGVVDI